MTHDVSKSECTSFIVVSTAGTVVASYLIFPSWKMLDVPFVLVLPLSFAYFVGIIILLSIPLGNSQPHISEKWKIGQLWSGEGAVLAFLALAFSAAHLYYIDWPILSGPDEPRHIIEKLKMWRALTTDSRWFPLLIISLGAGIGVAYAIFRTVKLIRYRKPLASVAPRVLIAATCLLVILYVSIFATSHLSESWGLSNRWPPLGTILGVFSIGVFGENTFAARLPSVMFFVGTGIVVFRFVAATTDRRSGIFAAALCYAAPVFFQYGHLDFREVGGAFFLLLGAFYLARYLETGNPDSLILSAVFAGAGYLERRPAAALIFIVLISVSLSRLLIPLIRRHKFSFWTEIRNLAVAGAVFLWIISPWIIISARIRPYNPHFESLLNPEILLAYARVMPGLFGWPLIIFAVLGFGRIIFRWSQTGAVALIGFGFLYILFTADNPKWIPVDRFTVLMVPYLSIVASFSVTGRFGLPRRRAWLPVWLVLGLIPLWAWHSGRTLPIVVSKGSISAANLPYYPFDQLVNSLKESDIEPGQLLYPHFWQTPFYVYRMYSSLKGFKLARNKWVPFRKRQTTIKDLRERCEKIRCRALLLSGEKSANEITVTGVIDLDFDTISRNEIPGFKVLDTFWYKNHWLCLAKPLEDETK